MSYRDVRGWIKEVQEMGELKTIEGADWNLEIGALSVWLPNIRKTRRRYCSIASKTIRMAIAF